MAVERHAAWPPYLIGGVAFHLQPGSGMVLTTGVHRLIERHAAVCGGNLAVVGRDDSLKYRELNQAANALARYLIGTGFYRGSRAIVTMDRSPDLAVALLAVLKAGGAYTWFDRKEAPASPNGISIGHTSDGHEAQVIIDVREALAVSGPCGANLPILTRAADIACVLPQRNGEPGVLVPHATIAALQSHPVPDRAHWSAELGALDLWLPLMAGATALVG